MEIRKLIDLLRATIDPNQRQQAEAQLDQAISTSWQDRRPKLARHCPFALHEQDRALIRDSIVDAVVHAPDLIRTQLCTCVNNMVKHDFPGRWTQIVDKMTAKGSLSSMARSVFTYPTPDPSGWHGALLCLYQLVKNFEYKKSEERSPSRGDESATSTVIPARKQQMLINYCKQNVRYLLPLSNPTKMKDLTYPGGNLRNGPFTSLYRMFERYGSPGHVTKEYNEFSEWYLQTFSAGILAVLLRVLDGYRGGHWAPPRVIQQTLNYLNQAVCHAATWKILKQHMPAIIQDVLFPLMCYSAEDHELWTVDPHEYIRVLTNTATEPSQKDGALHMVGSLADILLKKKMYRDQLDQLFIKYVFPEFNSDRGHMRARACWVLHYFAEFNSMQENVLMDAINLIINALLYDKDLPVRVEAAIALQSMLNYQERARKYIEPQVKQIALELLTIYRETENEDVTGVMQKMVCIYTQQLTPIAVEICQHLATTFNQVLDTDEGSDAEGHYRDGSLEYYRDVIAHVLQNAVQEFYEEVLALIYDLTSKQISTDMWKVFELIYQGFIKGNRWESIQILYLVKNGIDHFTDMMPALHNYVTIDTDAFLSNEQRLLAIYNMCKEVLSKDCGEDPESHAAKLLEVVLLQCRKKIDQAAPMLVELAATRLLREVKTSELRTMLLQVLIAALYYDPQLLFSVLQKMPDFTNHFIKQWLHDTDCFLGIHDRKLCVLGLCTLISMPTKPPTLIEMAPKIVPSLILLFDGLKRAYAARAADAVEEEETESSEEEIEGVPTRTKLMIRVKSTWKISRRALTAAAGHKMDINATINDIDDTSDDDDSDFEANEETVLESYMTSLDEEDCDVDEYQTFKQVMQAIQTQDPNGIML
ncbi:hypothetical protein NQ317_018654 [Molorchus minor]|uniref:Importin N-terminal domain-containing protein n=1 Tax=Molorchus minor TaxID=1323400 RepID=A0ABQ9IVT0_9CUCU|nr:hypothetical protein NQ317_018654 [Molorchus minor]